MTSATIISLLANPDFINLLIVLISFITGVTGTFFANRNKIKKGKDYNEFNLLVDIAKEEAVKLVALNMNNEQKRNIVIKNIITRLPDNVKKNVKEEVVEQALTLAYQHFIKPNIDKKEK